MWSAWLFECRYAFRHPRVRGAYLGALALSAVLLLVVLVYWWPAHHSVQSLNRALDEARRTAHEKRYSAELAAAVKRVTPQVDAAEKKLDLTAVQTTLVQHLALHARKHGLRVLSSNYDEGKVQDGMQPISHEMSLQGSYPALRGFLAGLTDLPTLTVIEECSIERVREGGGLKIVLTMHTWRRAGSGGAAT